MSSSKSFKDLLQPAIEQAEQFVARLTNKPAGSETATDPEVARLAIERWISDTQIIIELTAALAKDHRIDEA